MDNSDLRKLGFSEERNEKQRDDHWYILVYITTLFYIFTFSYWFLLLAVFFYTVKD